MILISTMVWPRPDADVLMTAPGTLTESIDWPLGTSSSFIGEAAPPPKSCTLGAGDGEGAAFCRRGPGDATGAADCRRGAGDAAGEGLGRGGHSLMVDFGWSSS